MAKTIFKGNILIPLPKIVIFVALRNDENIISSISVTDLVFDDYFGKWNTEPFTKWKLEAIFKPFLK